MFDFTTQGILSALTRFIILPDFTGWLAAIRIVFIAIFLIFAGFIFYMLFFGTLYLKRLLLWDIQEFFTYRPYGVKKIARDWQKIKNRLDTGQVAEYKLAVIEADLMLNDVLKRMGFGGETLSERLEKLTVVSLHTLDYVKEAHSVRNNIMHDPDYKLSLDEAKKIIAVFEESLADLQVL